MHLHFLDPYQPRPSLIHKLDPRIKFIIAIALIFSCALIPPGAWAVYILLLSIAFSIELLSNLGIGYVLKRSIFAFPFILAAFPIIFTKGPPFIYIVSIAGWDLAISQLGLVQFISIALKSWISIQFAIVLAATTPFPDLLVAMRAVHIPRLLVSIFALMWRYLFVLVDEAMRLIRARLARSSRSDQPGLRPGGTLTWRARLAGGMAGNLFMRAFDRSDRIYMAMVSRGYDGEVRAMPLTPLSVADRLFLISGVTLLIILVVISYLFWS